MTVAPRARAATAANTGTEAGRCSAAAVLRATTMLRQMLRERSGLTWRMKRRVRLRGRLTVAAGFAPPMTDGVRNYSRMGPRGPIAEKRRLRLAPCDEALFIITTSPLDCPTRLRPSTPLILPSGDSWSLPRPWPTGATRARRSPGPCVATGCTATSPVKSAPDRKLFSARTCDGQRGNEKSICDRELDIDQHT